MTGLVQHELEAIKNVDPWAMAEPLIWDTSKSLDELSAEDLVQPSRLNLFIFAFLLRYLVDLVSLPLYFWPSYRKDRHAVHIPSAVSPCRTLIYLPRNVNSREKPLRVLMHLHGGGWTICRPETDGKLCRYLSDALDCVVVAPDYAKAPSHPFPSALKQLRDTLQWMTDGSLQRAVQSKAPRVTLNTRNIALNGASAGGNLAVSLSLYSMLLPLPNDSKIVAIGLLYPALKLAGSLEEKLQRVDRKHILPPAMSRLFLHSYVAPPHNVDNPFISPCLAPHDYLKRLPEVTLVTASRDFLANEGREFAEILDSHGVAVLHRELENVGHAFDGIPVFFDHNQREINGEAREVAWKLIASRIAKQFGTS